MDGMRLPSLKVCGYMDCFVSENLTVAFRQTSRGGVSFHETSEVGGCHFMKP